MTRPEQWLYIPTDKNPADQAIRVLPAQLLKDSTWLNGPEHVLKQQHKNIQTYNIMDPDEDKEVRPEIVCMKTSHTTSSSLGSHRFTIFSIWKRLVNSVALLQHAAKSFSRKTDCVGWHFCTKSKTVDTYREAERLIIRTVQQEYYPTALESLMQNKPLPRSSSLLQLVIFLDDDNLLRVGGRLNKEWESFPKKDDNQQEVNRMGKSPQKKITNKKSIEWGNFPKKMIMRTKSLKWGNFPTKLITKKKSIDWGNFPKKMATIPKSIEWENFPTQLITKKNYFDWGNFFTKIITK
ncbi:unnamed protein product [Mytilus coruscus]|uniref:Uncharacterized protein n=1 Tax=Mytilus coruscus TaxID=42192 RepID=A0A6J8BAF7_MYTCO|nr:unnamed protein product [Mytilus coruscus]